MAKSNFEWEEKFDIGVEAMNDEHKVLLNLMAELSNKYDAKASMQELVKILDKLVTYTKKHFSTEEAYMESLQFPKIKVHKELHRKLLATLDEHYANIKSSGTIPPEIFPFLKFWLASHICGIDKQYGDFSHKMSAA